MKLSHIILFVFALGISVPSFAKKAAKGTALNEESEHGDDGHDHHAEEAVFLGDRSLVARQTMGDCIDDPHEMS